MVLDQEVSKPIVAWRDVRKVYPSGLAALDGVTLEANAGEVLAILGTSGSGKTTLLKLVNRLFEPSSGTIEVRGKPTSDWDPIALRLSIGYVIQDVGLMPHLDILANVGLVLKLLGHPKPDREQRSQEVLKQVGLEPSRFAGLRPHQLSGGQRQRVGVARALAANPDLILMDEPFGALDPITRREIQAEFRDLQRRLKTTVIIVTHDIREACHIADRLALVDAGKLVQVGRAADFHDKPASDFVKSFFADAEAVVLESPR